MSIREHPEDRFWADLIASVNSLKVMAVVAAPSYFVIAEKSRISASFLRVDVKDGVRSEILRNCDVFTFCKHSDRPVISIFQIPLLICYSQILQGKAFYLGLCCRFRRSYEIIFLIISEISYLHLISRASINSFHCCWSTFRIESTKAHTSSLYRMSFPTLINESSRNGFI